MKNLVKECSQGDVWPIKAWTWRASRRTSEDFVILHFIFDGDSHRGRPVQHYEDEPRLCLFGLSLTFPPMDFIRQYNSSAAEWKGGRLYLSYMYHNVHLWTTPLEGQFPRTNRKGAVEESLLWLDFQSLPKALMSIAHVYFHFIMSLEWGGNAHLGKPVMGGLWLDHFRRWWLCR